MYVGFYSVQKNKINDAPPEAERDLLFLHYEGKKQDQDSGELKTGQRWF